MGNKRKNLVSSEHQLKIDTFPSELQKESPGKPKQIIINEIGVATKIDEITLNIEFRLFPSKTVFSKVRSTLWFDDQEVKSDLLAIPQSLADTDEFQLNYQMDMSGISAGAHTIKAELCDIFYPCSTIKEEHIDYVPLDRKAAYRKIPIAKKIAGEDFTIVSSSEKEIYDDIDQATKNELDSKRDKW